MQFSALAENKLLQSRLQLYRSGTGTEALFHAGSSCCGVSHIDLKKDNHCGHDHDPQHNYKIKKNDDDEIGELLDSLITPYALQSIIGEVAELSSQIMESVLKRTKDEEPNRSPPDENDLKHLRMEILKEALIRGILIKFRKNRIGSHNVGAKEGGLLATPAGYRIGPLDFLLNDTLSNLVKNGYAIQDGFVGSFSQKRILEEIELIEFDSKLREAPQRLTQSGVQRQDRHCWIVPSQLDREHQKELLTLMERLSALPFELNKKANLMCQVASAFQITLYPANGAIFGRHMDSGFGEESDNGRKVTVIYYPNDPNWSDSDGSQLRICQRQTKQQQETGHSENTISPTTKSLATILPKGDRLVLLKSREMVYEILETHRKCFCIILWISGPPGPGDD